MAEEFNIKSRNETFRFKELKALDFLGLRSIASYETEEEAKRFYKSVLSKIEVKIAGNWFDVYDKEADSYYPAGIDDDVAAMEELISTFVNDYMKPVFMKSVESKA